MSARPRPPEQVAALFAGGWPAFIDADSVAAGCFPRVRELFGALEIVLTADADAEAEAEADGDLVAACWGVPIRWNEDPAARPTGYSDSLVRALDDHGAGAVCDTLVVCAAQVRPGRAGPGMTAAALRALIDVAGGQGRPGW